MVVSSAAMVTAARAVQSISQDSFITRANQIQVVVIAAIDHDTTWRAALQGRVNEEEKRNWPSGPGLKPVIRGKLNAVLKRRSSTKAFSEDLRGSNSAIGA